MGTNTMINRELLVGLMFVLIVANFAEAQQQGQQQTSTRQRQRRQQAPSSQTTTNRRQPSRNAAPAAAAAAVSPASTASLACFVRNCAVCNRRNSYVCAQCRPGYALTNGVACNSCAPNYQQNLDLQSFTCDACPAGTTSNGGTGEASQCTPISVSSGRRLFEFEEDLWA